ncbi:MAG: Dabb family protein [Bacillota bacterium]|nr:Dabb family protein [Bacillota bacterium]MDO4732423.1 Dabb family protein [Bacillota bacterium]
MIRHIVMFKFMEEAEGRSKQENLDIARGMLEKLQGTVPTLKASEIHYNHKDAAESNYDMILISDFDDLEGLNSYIVHPDHKAVGAFMKGVRESRTCVDFEI